MIKQLPITNCQLTIALVLCLVTAVPAHAVWPLRQSTASQEIPLGPFVDSTDGNTAETGLTIANTDIKLEKAGATSQTNKNSGGATHIATGDYYAVLDATDTDTVGPLRVKVHVSGALPVWLDCMVYEEGVYDGFYASGADLMDSSDTFNSNVTHFGGVAGTFSGGVPAVNADQISGDQTAAANLEDGYDNGYGFGPLLFRSTISDVVSSAQDIYELADTAANNSFGSGAGVIIRDVSAVGVFRAIVESYDGTELDVDNDGSEAFTPAVGDIVEIYAPGFGGEDRTKLTGTNTKVGFLPSATAGSTGGLFIAGSNAATTVNFAGSITSVTNGVSLATGAVNAAAVADDALDLAAFADDTLFNPTTTAVIVGEFETPALAQLISDDTGETTPAAGSVAALMWATTARTITGGTITTYTGNTPQSGDSFARLGAPAGASHAADIAAIENQTDDIGTSGAGLSAVPWNASWDAEAQSEANDALVANFLDQLIAAAFNSASPPGNSGSLLRQIVENDGGVPRFTTNSLEQAPTGGEASLDAEELREALGLAEPNMDEQFDALVPGTETRDLEDVNFVWEFNPRRGNVGLSTTKLRIAPGETWRCGFELKDTNVLPGGAVMGTLDEVTPSSGDVTATELGVSKTMPKVLVTAAADAEVGDVIVVRCEVTNSFGDGPFTLLGEAVVIAGDE